jgi:hypothetical protein
MRLIDKHVVTFGPDTRIATRCPVGSRPQMQVLAMCARANLADGFHDFSTTEPPFHPFHGPQSSTMFDTGEVACPSLVPFQAFSFWMTVSCALTPFSATAGT